MSAQAIRVPHPALRPRVLRARLATAAEWLLRAWCIAGSLVFLPLALPRLLASLLRAFGA